MSLVEWLEADGEELVERYDRLYVPRNDPRWLRRNALIAAGNVGGQAERDAAARYAEGDDDMPARARRVGARAHRSPERRVKLIRILAVRSARARPACAREGAARPRRLPHLALRGRSLAPGRSAGARRARSCSGSPSAGGSRHRYLAALNVIADAAVAIGADVRVRLGAGAAIALAGLPGRARSRVVLPARAAALLVGVLTLPVFIALELWREAEFDVPVRYDALILRVLVAIALGGVVGRLVDMERSQARAAEERAAEAERLRDELGRRIDVLEATSRAARALASSLDLEAAFAAFVQELRGLLAFDRAAILLVEPTGARIMATAGVGADDVACARKLDRRAGVGSGGGDRRGADDLPRGHRRGPAIRRRPTCARSGSARVSSRRSSWAPARSASRDLSRTEPRIVPSRGDRPRHAPRPARCDRRPEPAHLRGRAGECRRAAPPLVAPSGLRLARLA